MSLEIRETCVNLDKGYQYGDSSWYKPYFADWPRNKILRELIKEYGRCASKMYLDTNCGTKEVGYVFVKRCEYEDTRETYLRETWVEFRDLEREAYERAAKRQQLDIG